MKKLFKHLMNFFLILIIGSLIWFIYNYKVYIIVSGSMEPSIRTNELVVVKTHHNNYKVGDIISFYEKEYDIPITHRIMKYNAKEDYYITKGDNNNTEDKNKLKENDIIGKVVYQSYDMGNFIMKYSSILYLLSLIVILVCILILIFRRKDSRGLLKIRKDVEKNE